MRFSIALICALCSDTTLRKYDVSCASARIIDIISSDASVATALRHEALLEDRRATPPLFFAELVRLRSLSFRISLKLEPCFTREAFNGSFL